MMRLLAVTACLLSGWAVAQEPSPAQPSDAGSAAPSPEELLRQMLAARADLARLDAEVSRLREELAAERNARVPGEPAAPGSTFQHAGFVSGSFALRVSGFVQADDVLYNQASVDEVDPSTGQPLNQTRLLIRRAHVRADAEYGLVSAALELQASTVTNPAFTLFDAEVSARWPGRADGPALVQGTLGLTRIPFGWENQEKDYDRLFMERSTFVRAFFPGENDLGVVLQGGWRFLRYQLAVMNGFPAGATQFALEDPIAEKDLLGRLGIDTRLHGRVALQAGLSGLSGKGFSVGTPATKNTVLWIDQNDDGQVESNELEGIPGQPPVPSQTFNHWALGGDLRARLDVPVIGPLTVYGEIAWASNLDRGVEPADPVGMERQLRELGWYAAVMQQITRWGAIGVRYDFYNPDADAREQAGVLLVPRDRTFSTTALVAALFYPPVARLSLEWDHNKNPLGRDASGAPATLGSDVFIVRGQLVF